MRNGLLIGGALAALGIGAALWRGRRRRGANGGGTAHSRFPEDPGQPRPRMSTDECVDLASEDSFPASDPPSYTMSRAGRPAK